MNNCRAGLYGFAAITTWLRETGVASPPFLVMLGLTLPDSRILNGIAGIGLTLANIANILPRLRQPMLHASEGALTHERNVPERTVLFVDESNATQSVDIKLDSPALALASPCDREYQCDSATVKFVRSEVTEHLECLAVDSKTVVLLPAWKVDDDQIPPQVHCSPDVDKVISPNNPLMREGQRTLRIPLPAPNAEVSFFNTTDASLSDRDLDLTAREQHTGLEEDDSASEEEEQIATKAGFTPIVHLQMLTVR